jgi:nitronate monooxygenase
MFLSGDLAAQVGTFALVPQIVDAVKVPVVGGIMDARGIAALCARRCRGQIGTASYLRRSRSARLTMPLSEARDDGTAVTNLMTGRPARGLVNRVPHARSGR